jgi:ABC transporter
MYQLTGVSKLYHKGRQAVPAVTGVDLVIADGEWLAIQGRTGHGKTTLLNLLGGLDRPTQGSIELDGTDLSALPEAQLTWLRADKIGFIFQTFNLIPTLSAAENVEASSRSPPASPSAAGGWPPRWTPSAWPTALRTCPPNCRVASSSGSQSPAPWSRTRRCCSPTSRLATWTRTPATTSSAC